MNKLNYIVGIDGGGTKTHAILFDNKGNLHAECYTTGTNLYVYKESAINKILKKYLDY